MYMYMYLYIIYIYMYIYIYIYQMENAAFNKIINSIKQLDKEKKGICKEKIVEICCRNYNAYPFK